MIPTNNITDPVEGLIYEKLFISYVYFIEPLWILENSVAYKFEILCIILTILCKYIQVMGVVVVKNSAIYLINEINHPSIGSWFYNIYTYSKLVQLK